MRYILEIWEAKNFVYIGLKYGMCAAMERGSACQRKGRVGVTYVIHLCSVIVGREKLKENETKEEKTYVERFVKPKQG